MGRSLFNQINKTTMDENIKKIISEIFETDDDDYDWKRDGSLKSI